VPAAASAIDATSKAAGFGLGECLQAVSGEPLQLLESMLSCARGPESDATLWLCDMAVMEGPDLFLVATAIALLAAAAPQQPGLGYEQLVYHLQAELNVGSTGVAAGKDGMAELVTTVRSLLESTPTSLKNTLKGDTEEAARLNLPLCAVTAEEVLLHTFGRPPSCWRFQVVDARMRVDEFVLPVGLRLETCQHHRRRQLLREMPCDDSIHVCIMAEGPPCPGDDAYELGRSLAGGTIARAHVSIVDGGWPAVRELAASRGHELMPAAAMEPVVAPPASTASDGLKQAAAAVTEASSRAAEQVGPAIETAAAVAQRMWAGASSAWQRLGSEIKRDDSSKS